MISNNSPDEYECKICPNCYKIYRINLATTSEYYKETNFCIKCGYRLFICENHPDRLSSVVKMFLNLDTLFGKLNHRKYNYSIGHTIYNMKILLKIQNKNTYEDFNIFYAKNKDKIEFILEEREEESKEIALLNSPEILLVFYLIDTNIDELKTLWEKYFYMNDLRNLSLWWGNPIDYLDDTL